MAIDAFLAIMRSQRGDSFLALALPPLFLPAKRPKATPWRFFPSFGSGSGGAVVVPVEESAYTSTTTSVACIRICALPRQWKMASLTTFGASRRLQALWMGLARPRNSVLTGIRLL